MLVEYFHTKTSKGSFTAEFPSKTIAMNRALNKFADLGIIRIDCFREVSGRKRLFYVMKRKGIEDVFKFFKVGKRRKLIEDIIGSSN